LGIAKKRGIGPDEGGGGHQKDGAEDHGLARADHRANQTVAHGRNGQLDELVHQQAQQAHQEKGRQKDDLEPHGMTVGRVLQKGFEAVAQDGVVLDGQVKAGHQAEHAGHFLDEAAEDAAQKEKTKNHAQGDIQAVHGPS
jgi:hypothetical protein